MENDEFAAKIQQLHEQADEVGARMQDALQAHKQDLRRQVWVAAALQSMDWRTGPVSACKAADRFLAEYDERWCPDGK